MNDRLQFEGDIMALRLKRRELEAAGTKAVHLQESGLWLQLIDHINEFSGQKEAYQRACGEFFDKWDNRLTWKETE